MTVEQLIEKLKVCQKNAEIGLIVKDEIYLTNNARVELNLKNMAVLEEIEDRATNIKMGRYTKKDVVILSFEYVPPLDDFYPPKRTN